MIHGIFEVCQTSEGDQATVMSVFSENEVQLPFQKVRKATAYLKENMKHAYSDELSCGILIGEFRDRSMICSHYKHPEEFELFATTFLFEDQMHNIEQFVFTKTDAMKSMFTDPFLMILVEGVKIICITSYGVDDFEIRALNPGLYCIR